MARRRRDAAAQVALTGAATIQQAADHASKLRAALGGATGIVIDLSGVTATDLSFVQLIEATRISCARRGAPCRLTAPADGALLDVLARGGLLHPAHPDRIEFWSLTAEAQ